MMNNGGEAGRGQRLAADQREYRLAFDAELMLISGRHPTFRPAV